MGRRGGRQPLYEFMRAVDKRPRPSDPDVDPVQDHARRLQGLVRVPVGYVFLGVAIALGLAVATYMLGYARAEQAAEDEFKLKVLESPGLFRPEDALEAPGTGPDAGTRGPSASAGSRPGRGATGGDGRGRTPPPPIVLDDPAGGANPTRDAGRAGAAGDDRDAGAGWPAAWGPIRSDPRRSGLNYMVLAHTRLEGALRMARFCRDRGLEAHVVPHNTVLFRVFLLPGFEPGSLSDPAVAPFDRLVGEVGEAWAASSPGEEAFTSRFLSKYQ